MAAKRCDRVIAAMLLAVALAPSARATPPPRQRTHQHVQLGLLEFLGERVSIDHGGKWMAFLSRLDLGKARPVTHAPTKGKAPAGRAPAKRKASG